MDPVQFRKQNVLGDGDLGPTGQVFEADVLAPMLDRMETLRASTGTAEAAADGRLYGMATTVGTWFVFVGPSAATVNLNADGSATLVTSGVEIGSGTMMQALPQIVAGQLGLSPDQVIVREADTDAAGIDVGVGGGRTTVSIGAASVAACAEVRDRLLKTAGEMLQTRPEDLVLREGRVEIAGRPGSGMSIPAVVAHAQATTGPVSGTGAFTGRNTPAMAGCADGSLHRRARHSRLRRPRGRGRGRSRYRPCRGAGLPRRAGCRPRAQPARHHGPDPGRRRAGPGLRAARRSDDHGRWPHRQDDFESYRLPLAQDVVPVVADLYEGAPSMGPLGTKGAGEVPILAVGAAIGCAVARAIGKPVRQLPLTPPRVLGLIHGREPATEFPHVAPGWAANTLG